jgi:hypothetical protein
MNTTEQVLLIVLCTTLSLFLLVCIIATIKAIQILNDVKRIVQKAEKLADKAEAVGDFFKATAGPAAIGKLVSNIFHSIQQKKHKGDDT